MTNLKKLAGAIALMVGFALPAVAHVDVPSLTCGQFAAMGDPDKLNASTDLLLWINDAANTSAAGNLIGKYTTSEQKWSPESLKIEVEGHCSGATVDATVVKRLQEHS
jgi:hypothetical protein